MVRQGDRTGRGRIEGSRWRQIGDAPGGGVSLGVGDGVLSMGGEGEGEEEEGERGAQRGGRHGQ